MSSEENSPTKNEPEPEQETVVDDDVEKESSKEQSDLEVTPRKQEFRPPARPGPGTEGRVVSLRANHFALEIPDVTIHHYHVELNPDCARKVNREVIGSLINTFTLYFANARPVYDGRHFLFTRRRLPIGNERMDFNVMLPNDTRQFKVSLKWTADVKMFDEKEVPTAESLHAIDIILRHLSSMKYVPVGRCFFAPPGPAALGVPTFGTNDLGNGRELWFGYHQSVQSTQRHLMVNIDTSTTAFYKSMPVIDFLATVLDLPVQALSNRFALSDSQRIRFAREIKTLKVEATHTANFRRKFRVCNVTRKSAYMQTFPLNIGDDKTRECTVSNYFYERYNINLKYGHLPCLQVGQEARYTFLPLEVCLLSTGQRCNKKLSDQQTSHMIKASQKTAPEREREINELVEKAEICSDPFVDDFGIAVSRKMAELKGRVLSAPKLMYGSASQRQSQTVLPNCGSWDMRGKQLHVGVEVLAWAMVCFAPQQMITELDLRQFTSDLRRVSHDTGMPIRSLPCFCKYAVGNEQVEPMFKYLKNEFRGVQIVIVILPGKTSLYAEVKKIGDTILGLPTQCVAARNVLKSTTQALSNLCLKMNVKMGGINTIIVPTLRPKIFEEPVIFIGCDVTHPMAGEGGTRKPTIAAVVGSMDAHPSRYAAAVRVQGARQEIICEMRSMVRELLVQFRKNTGFKPARIVVYRSGVSEGQYYNALQHELRSIREACMSLEADYQPGVTFIAVQKRHHTRLFVADPKDYTGRAQNIPAGTAVDSTITHPVQHDFYLCSHAGIQGTSRPSRYHVLWDDNCVSADELQQLTYQMCHTYVRCTRSVSIPAPAYYAHLVAFRARYHLVETGNMHTESSFVDSMVSTTSSEASATMHGMDKTIQVHPDSRKVMYFC